MRADGRRDRPVRWFNQWLCFRHGRHAVGQSGLARGGCDHCRRPCRRIDRLALCSAFQSPWNAKFRFDACRPAGGARNAALSARRNRLDQPALRLVFGEFRAAARHSASTRILVCAAAGRRDADFRLSGCATPQTSQSLVALDRRSRRACRCNHRSFSNSSSFISIRIAASRGCSRSLSRLRS